MTRRRRSSIGRKDLFLGREKADGKDSLLVTQVGSLHGREGYAKGTTLIGVKKLSFLRKGKERRKGIFKCWDEDGCWVRKLGPAYSHLRGKRIEMKVGVLRCQGWSFLCENIRVKTHGVTSREC